MGLIIDNFAGGGGASEGIEQAMGRPVDIAINHDPGAIAMHKVNHPHTKHYCESVWDVDPIKACEGQPVDLAWFSPDCTHFSKAKGGKPKDKNIRGLAWVAVKWAMQVRPTVIILENVEEFKTWGPLGDDNQPDKNKTGETFNSFVEQLKIIGYQVEFRELIAADYGAPTKRKRFFMVSRCDGFPISWPAKSHGPRNSKEVAMGILKPYTPVSEVLDFSKPCPSIFDTKDEIMEKHGLRTVRPLADKTMERIARGLEKFVINNADPFLIQVNYSGAKWHYCNNLDDPLPTITGKHGFGIVTPSIIQYHSETLKKEVRGQAIDEPIMTIDGSPRYALISSHIIQMNNHMIGTDSRDPVNTIVAGPGHLGEVRAFLIKYYGQGIGQDLKEPCGTVVSHDRFGLVTVHGTDYQIIDIGMRMLDPRELFTANGFPLDYIIDYDADGNKITKTEQVKRCGNAVPPIFAKELVLANVVEIEKNMAS
ncbi:DNA cytosine methyltransferase [Acetobacterium malicum]|uniref:DNA cytosine methyltransferase n=1 Tax=Acetobacterium malicum TaxID=52692 RepID=UPI000412EBE5|nr:DNA cytosine methyltransferase [Acetobacterium dehalogenans]